MSTSPITVTLTIANAAALGHLATALAALGNLGNAVSMTAAASQPSAATAQTAAPAVTQAAATPAASASFPQATPPATPAVDLNTLGALLQGKAQSNPAGFAALMQHFGFTSMQAIQGAPEKWAELHAAALTI